MRIVKDLDGHKYRLTKEDANDFNQLLAKIEIVAKVEGRSERWYDLNADLDNLYGRDRLTLFPRNTISE